MSVLDLESSPKTLVIGTLPSLHGRYFQQKLDARKPRFRLDKPNRSNFSLLWYICLQSGAVSHSFCSLSTFCTELESMESISELTLENIRAQIFPDLCRLTNNLVSVQTHLSFRSKQLGTPTVYACGVNLR